MSILHDYEKARDIIGHKKYDAIEKYLNEICKEEDLNTYFEKVSKLTGSSFQKEIAKQLKKQFNVTCNILNKLSPYFVSNFLYIIFIQ